MVNPETNTDELRARLELDITKNDSWRESLAGSTEPLIISKLFDAGKGDLAVSGPFRELVERVSWPSLSDQIGWSLTFPSAEEGGAMHYFVKQLLIRGTL